MVGTDAKIKGNIESEESLIVYGKVYGSIITKGDVRIGKSGKVFGDIEAFNIYNGGEIFGNVSAQNKAELGGCSILDGDLVYKELYIEQGAKFQGHCAILIEENKELNNNDSE